MSSRIKNILPAMKEFFYTKSEVDSKIINSEGISQGNNGIVDIVYPVGSIYMSVNSVSPSDLFGGTWEKIEGKFLLGSSSSYALGGTGGSKDAVVVSHNHTKCSYSYTECS